MKTVFKLCLFVWVTSSNAQSPTRVILSSGSVNNYQYELFSTKKTINPIYTDLSQVKNESIERLMSSILCANNQAWVNFNTLGGAKNAEQKTPTDFDRISNRNNEKTYFELISKLSFESAGQYLTIIKFRLYLEQYPKGISGAYQLQKVGDRWFKISRSDLSNMALMMVFFKADILRDIIAGKKTTKLLTDELIAKVYDQNGLDIQKLYKEFTSWENDKTKADYFLEPTGW